MISALVIWRSPLNGCSSGTQWQKVPYETMGLVQLTFIALQFLAFSGFYTQQEEMGEHIEMGKIRELLRRTTNGELSDLFTQTFVIYFFSYVLSAILSSLPILGVFPSLSGSGGVAVSFIQSFSDYLIPTTVTLTLSTFIQNLGADSDVRAGVIWSPLLTLVYVILYVVWRQEPKPWLPYGSIVLVVINTIVNLVVTAQVYNRVVGRSITR